MEEGHALCGLARLQHSCNHFTTCVVGVRRPFKRRLSCMRISTRCFVCQERSTFNNVDCICFPRSSCTAHGAFPFLYWAGLGWSGMLWPAWHEEELMRLVSTENKISIRNFLCLFRASPKKAVPYAHLPTKKHLAVAG